MDLINRKVYKMFAVDADGDYALFHGVVKSYDESLEWYMVEYEDGDREELSREDVEYLSRVTEDYVAQNYVALLEDETLNEDSNLYAEEQEDVLEDVLRTEFSVHSTPQTQLQLSKLAVDYLQQAASQGYPEAISALGEMYGSGRGVAADVAKAKALQDQSDELRECENKMILPKCFDAKNLEARALEGDAHAMYMLACSKVNADPDMAVVWYKTAAEDKGYLPAMHALGELKVRRGDKEYKTFAEQMSKRAAYAGYMPALKQICRQHQDTPNSLSAAKVLQLLHTTTTTGSIFWQQEISFLRNWWEASPLPSPTEADFCAAAQAGDPHALYGLAHCYQHGLGVAADPALAEHWYKQAAVQGYAPAQHALGNLYASGYPVTASQHRIAMTTEQRNHGNGHLLCDYELQRAQNIKRNEDRMRQLIPGIKLTAAEQPKAKKPRVAREVNRNEPEHAGRRVEALWSNEPFGHVNAEVYSGHLVDYDPASDTYSLLYEDGDMDQGIRISQNVISVDDGVVETRLRKLKHSSKESRISMTEVDRIHPQIRSLEKQKQQIEEDRAEQRNITRYRFTMPIEKMQSYTRSCKPEPLMITKDPGIVGLKLCDVNPQGRLEKEYVQHFPSLIPEKLRNAIQTNLRNLPWRQYWHKVMGTYRPHGRLQFLTCFSEANCAYFLGDKPNDPEQHCALGGLSTLGTPSLDHESLSPIKDVVNAVLHSWIGQKFGLNRPKVRDRITVQVNRYFGEETVGETKKAAQGIPMHGDGAAMDPNFPIIHLYILDDAIVRVVKRSDVGGSACRAQSREGVRHSNTFLAHAGSATILIDDSATFHGRSPCKKVSPCGSISMVLRVMDDRKARRCARDAASRLQQHSMPLYTNDDPTLQLPRRIHFSYVCAPQDGNQVTADAMKIMQFNEDVGCKLFADESAGDVRMAKRRGRWQPPLIFESRSAPELLGLEPHMYSTIVKGKGTVVSSIYLRDASLEMENTSPCTAQKLRTRNSPLPRILIRSQYGDGGRRNANTTWMEHALRTREKVRLFADVSCEDNQVRYAYIADGRVVHRKSESYEWHVEFCDYDGLREVLVRVRLQGCGVLT